MATLQRILALVPDATPSDLDAIDAMPSRFDQRASEARARGDKQAAERFTAFRDAFALSGRAVPAEGKATPRSAPVSPPVASSPPPADLSNVVKRLEPKPETKSGNTGLLPDAGSDANRPASPASPAESRPAALAAAPKPDQPPSVPLKSDQARPPGSPEPPRSPASAAPMPDAMITVLLRRGEEKLAQGDISAARLLFQRAAASGNGAGAAGLARTYDPVFLTAIGASGIQPDPGLATEWYRKAVALGEDGAAVSLSRLERWKLNNPEGPKAPAAPRP